MEHVELPFANESTLRTELRDKYLRRALEWLTFIADEKKKVMRPVLNDNPWETAYSIMAFIKAKEHLIKTSNYTVDYDQQIESAVEYLISKISGDDERISLDGNPYDTGLTAQALLCFRQCFPNSKTAKRVDEENLISRTLVWIIDFLKSWLQDKTRAELDDIAQCLLAIFQAMQSRPDLQVLSLEETLPITRNVVEEILNLGQTTEEERYWESIYVTGYVVIALQEFIKQFPDSDLTQRAISSTMFGIISLEKRFSKSWDQPPDTALALQCYILASSRDYLDHDFLPEIIFRSFRWLCDSKQRYQNGSIQRSVHYTALFVNAIAEALACRELSLIIDTPINIVYDYVLNQVTLRDTLERSKVTQLRLKIQEMQTSIKKLERERESAYKVSFRLKALFVWVGAVVVFIFTSIISKSISFEIRSVQGYVPQVTDWQVLLVLGTIVFPLAATVTAIIHRAP